VLSEMKLLVLLLPMLLEEELLICSGIGVNWLLPLEGCGEGEMPNGENVEVVEGEEILDEGAKPNPCGFAARGYDAALYADRPGGGETKRGGGGDTLN